MNFLINQSRIGHLGNPLRGYKAAHLNFWKTTQREQINIALSTEAEERYRLFLQKKPYAENRFTQKDIASYLGITPQFLSVLKKKMQQVNVD